MVIPSASLHKPFLNSMRNQGIDSTAEVRWFVEEHGADRTDGELATEIEVSRSLVNTWRAAITDGEIVRIRNRAYYRRLIALYAAREQRPAQSGGGSAIDVIDELQKKLDELRKKYATQPAVAEGTRADLADLQLDEAAAARQRDQAQNQSRRVRGTGKRQ